jgi:hypothetical protein
MPKPQKVPRRRARTWVKRRNAQRRKDAAVVIAEVRELVFALDGVCAVCGGAPRGTDEMHEVRSRAQTRGLPPEERFSRRNCVRLHRACHNDVTEHRVEMAFLDPAEGMDGGLVVQRRGSEEATVYRRGAKPQHVPAGRGTARRGVWTPAG